MSILIVNYRLGVAGFDIVPHRAVILAATRFVAERPHDNAGGVFVTLKESFGSVNIGRLPLVVG